MTRLPDWPERLAALITAAEHRPFDAVRWNCGRFALAAVLARKIEARGRTIGVVISGGNVDPEVFARALAAAA